MPNTAIKSTIAIPPHSVCTDCGYSLVGLQISDLCPECAKPCKDSIILETIYDRGPHYVRNLAKGSAMVVLGYYTLLAFFAGTHIVSENIKYRPRREFLNEQSIASMILVAPLLIGTALFLLGWLRLLQVGKNNTQTDEIAGKIRQRVAIAFAIILLFNSAMLLDRPSPQMMLYSLLSMAFFSFLASDYFAKIDKLSPHTNIAKTTLRTKLITAASLVVAGIGFFAISAMISRVMSSKGTYNGFALLHTASSMIPLAILIAFISHVFIMRSFAISMRKAASFINLHPTPNTSADRDE